MTNLPVAKNHYDGVHRVAEEYRKTYGHGGFDKPGAVIAFYLPGIGALPAVLSDIRDSPSSVLCLSVSTT